MHFQSKHLQALIFSLFMLGMTLIYSSCKEIDELTHFYFDLSTNVNLQSTEPVGIPIEITIPNVQTGSSDAFKVNNTSESLVEEITIYDMALKLPEKGNQTFDFLLSVEIYILTDSLPEVLIAQNNDIPNTGLKTLMLKPGTDNLKLYLIEDNLNVKIKFTMRNDIVEDTNIEILTTFFVDAQLLGI